MILTKKRYRDSVEAVYTFVLHQVTAARQSAEDRIAGLEKRVQAKLDRGTNVMVANQDRVSSLERATINRPNMAREQGLLGSLALISAFREEPKTPDYSLQEQIDQIRDHLGLEYATTKSETKLVKARKK